LYSPFSINIQKYTDRDHIPNHSTIVHPLMQLVHSYTPTRKISWNQQALTAFEKIKLAIQTCPTLYFLDDTRIPFL